jgi:hypothetical protein
MAKKDKKVPVSEVEVPKTSAEIKAEAKKDEPKLDVLSLAKSATRVQADNYCVRTLQGDVIGRGFKTRQQAKVFRDAQPKAKSGTLQVFVSRDVAHPNGACLTLPQPPDPVKSKTRLVEEIPA